MAGNGAQILTVPDAPISLQNVAQLTDQDTVGLTWSDASQTGGTPVIDYRVSYDSGEGLGVFVTLESNIINLPYSASSLAVGTSYVFKV